MGKRIWVTLTDRPMSVRDRCVIKVFVAFMCYFALPFKGVDHTAIFPFLLLLLVQAVIFFFSIIYLLLKRYMYRNQTNTFSHCAIECVRFIG